MASANLLEHVRLTYHKNDYFQPSSPSPSSLSSAYILIGPQLKLYPCACWGLCTKDQPPFHISISCQENSYMMCLYDLNIFFIFSRFYSVTAEKEGVSIPNLLRFSLPWYQGWVTWQKAFPNPSHLFQVILRSPGSWKTWPGTIPLFIYSKMKGFVRGTKSLGGQTNWQFWTQALPLQNKMFRTCMEEHASFEPSLMSTCPSAKGRVTQPVRNSSLSCDLAPFTLPQALAIMPSLLWVTSWVIWQYLCEVWTQSTIWEDMKPAAKRTR